MTSFGYITLPAAGRDDCDETGVMGRLREAFAGRQDASFIAAFRGLPDEFFAGVPAARPDTKPTRSPTMP